MKLLHPPIVEAVLDLDCDMPPTFDLAKVARASSARFQARYPKVRQQFVEHHLIRPGSPGAPEESTDRALHAFHFLHDSEKQIVQFRTEGFSFNRLAPYTSLDDYIPEIKEAWDCFVEFAEPVIVRAIRLRYINRILLPFTSAGVDLNDYFKTTVVQVPGSMILTSFLVQYAGYEDASKHQVFVVITGQPPENDSAPVIFDNAAAWLGTVDVRNWSWISNKIQELRALKNSTFENTLTAQCLNLFQQP